jgi:hypothetical protein
MLKSLAFRVFAALLVAAVIGVNDSAAGMPGEVAHSAMGGSTLMKTTAQFGAWTHWIVDSPNFVELSVGDTYYYPEDDKTMGTGRGQATLHWQYNDGNHLLFRVRQNDLGGQNTNFLWGGTLEEAFLSPAGLVDMVRVGSYNAYREGQMLNLAWARPLAGCGAFSVGLLYADSGEKDSAADPEYVDESKAFGVQATWGNGDGLDVAGSFFSEASTAGAGEGEQESDLTHFDVTARLTRDNGWIYQLGALMGSGTRPFDADSDRDISLMGVTANAGKFLYDADNGAVTAEFYVNYFSMKDEAGGVEDKETTLTVPGTRVACWTQLSKRFQLMAGANAYWSTMKEEVDVEDGTDESSRGMQFAYSGGLAFVPNDKVRIEGQLEMDRLNNLMSLGNTTPLLMKVGGTFVF